MYQNNLFMRSATILCCAAFWLSASASDAFAESQQTIGYLCSSGSKSEHGIYRFRLNTETGKLTLSGEHTPIPNSGFLAIDPQQKHVYAVSRGARKGQQPSGRVYAYKIMDSQGLLKELNHESAAAFGPCHICVDQTAQCVLVADYSGGAVSSLPILPDGSVGQVATHIKHKGSSVNPQRQKEPHAHSMNVSTNNQFAFAADLGTDEVVIYRLDPKGPTLTPNQPHAGKVPPGSGPRHVAVHPNGKWVYANNELLSTVSCFNFNSNSGALTEFQVIPTLPGNYQEKSTTSEIRIHPNQKFLYVANRGHDSIAGYAIDPQSGELTFLQWASCGGNIPRNFEISPDGGYLLTCNQKSKNVAVLKLDPKTGLLSESPYELELSNPMCVRFLKP